MDHPGSCAFCGKTQKEVRQLIAGPGVYICDGCVFLCLDVLREGGITSPLVAAGDAKWITRSREVMIEIRADADTDS